MKKSIESITVSPPDTECRLWTAYLSENEGIKKEIPLSIDEGCRALLVYADNTVCFERSKKIPLGNLQKILGVCDAEFSMRFVLENPLQAEHGRVNVNCDCSCRISEPKTLYRAFNCPKNLSGENIRNGLLKYTENPLKENLINAVQNCLSDGVFSADIKEAFNTVMERFGLKIMECNARIKNLPAEESKEEYREEKKQAPAEIVCSVCGGSVPPTKAGYCPVCGNKLV